MSDIQYIPVSRLFGIVGKGIDMMQCLQMLTSPDIPFRVFLLIESNGRSGNQRSRIPKKVRPYLEFTEKSVIDDYEPGWNQYIWKGTVPSCYLQTFLKQSFRPLGQESSENDYEEYGRKVITGPDGEKRVSFQFRVLLHTPYPVWIEVSPDFKHMTPEMVQAITLLPETYRQLRGDHENEEITNFIACFLTEWEENN